MLKKHQEILNMLLEAIKEKYADDISVMLIYGSCVNGTFHDKSDLDMIYIPKTERGWKLAKTFILDEVGYDIWGADWQCLERFANFDDMRVSIIADSQLVYYSTDEDKQKYETLKNKAISIANGIVTPDLLNKARGHLNKAKQYYGEMCIEFNLTIAGRVLLEICDTVCLLNHTYLHFGIKRIIEEMSAFDKLPEGFISTYKAVIEKPEFTKENCARLINMTEQLLRNIEKETFSTPPDFTGLYEEISSQWNKIRFSCAKDDATGAFMSATSLQHELNYVEECLGTNLEDLHFFDKFNAENIRGFSLEADKAEIAFVDLLRSKGIPIMNHANIEQLKQSL